MLDLLIQPFRQIFDFKGRARRTEYWAFILWQLAFLALVVNLLALTPLAGRRSGDEAVVWIALGWIAVFGLPTAALQVRRLHDHDTNGWMLLVMFLPYIGAGWLFWMMVAKGSFGPNRFGEDPRQAGWDYAIFE
jgi:uncharacterized membrane protein YhaH (DUF805 family)